MISKKFSNGKYNKMSTNMTDTTHHSWQQNMLPHINQLLIPKTTFSNNYAWSLGVHPSLAFLIIISSASCNSGSQLINLLTHILLFNRNMQIKEFWYCCHVQQTRFRSTSLSILSSIFIPYFYNIYLSCLYIYFRVT